MATADPVKDFTHLGAIDRFHLMVVVNAGSGIKTVEELVEEARKKHLNYGYGSATGQVGDPPLSARLASTAASRACRTRASLWR